MSDLSKLSDADLKALANKDYSKVSDEGLRILSGSKQKSTLDQAWDITKEGAKTGLQGLLRAADYTGGLTRTALAGVADLPAHAGMTKFVGREGDLMQALQGNAPTTEEYIDRAGGLEEYPTTKKIISGVSDVFTDPLSYATLGASGAAKTLLKPTAKAAEKMGPSMWKSGLKRIDLEAYKQGKDPVSDTLIKHDVYGSPKEIYEKMGAVGSTLLERQKNILKQATEQGAVVDMEKAMESVYEHARQLRSTHDSLTEPIADALMSQADTYTKFQRGPQLIPINPEQASAMKTSLYNAVTPGEFMKTVSTAPGKLGLKKMAHGLKEEVESSVGRTLGPSEATNLRQTNKELGEILGTRGKELGEVSKEEMKNLFTSVDAPMLAYAATSNSPSGWSMMLAKKGADLLKRADVRTGSGRALKKYGESDISSVPDLLLRRELINRNRE